MALRVLKRVFLVLPFIFVVLTAFQVVYNRLPLSAKLRGKGSECSWFSVLSMPLEHHIRNGWVQKIDAGVSQAKAYDPKLDLEFFDTPSRSFWIRRSKESIMPGRALLVDLLADHGLIAERFSSEMVKKGDVVLDVGAHVGVFTSEALGRGASKVVAIEPDPINIECLRRNFKREIEDSRVILYTDGMWSSTGMLDLHEGIVNSGSNSVVLNSGDWAGPTVKIHVTTIDAMVSALKLDRVDFIKMDIEGAEREALRGATRTIRQFHPRLMLDSYHLKDDMSAFRGVFAEIDPRYSYKCGACEYRFAFDGLSPHVTFWRVKQ